MKFLDWLNTWDLNTGKKDPKSDIAIEPQI